jgi:phospholipid N-methyltransferase
MIRFFREFIRSHAHVGAVAPSSPFLARLIVKEAHVADADTILELGPGTGAFTAEILRAKKEEARFLTVERNTYFASTLEKKFPGLHVEVNDAQEADFGAWLGPAGGFDSIVSGLPWAGFPESLQKEILDNVIPHLASGGKFATFAYVGPHLLPAGRRFRSLLQERFDCLSTSRVEVRNLPPAFVYVAQNT